MKLCQSLDCEVLCTFVIVSMQKLTFACYLQEFKRPKNRAQLQLREKHSRLLQIDLSCKRYFTCLTHCAQIFPC